ncbi:hypothetical protein LUS60_28220 [Raoultella planticola]|uniref:hypothetical protein n=2 Tax=Enterobacterales TaxID=91347 RepID=UPI000ABD8E04|nr:MULTISPECIES: hypothetical protein [Klebsiella/Raoultella group]EKS6729904.1 hypothetical protein [Enterobacter mori]MCD9354874.1 hypothetical protein [Klebsiella pneumoniae]MCD9375896.1 hypothetical protein [Klebsiella pneumoniae]MCD9609127.1 hypothetical protein [Raoultella planticola]
MMAVPDLPSATGNSRLGYYYSSANSDNSGTWSDGYYQLKNHVSGGYLLLQQ